ncbi:MAG TPA: aldehyde ferredoxin oxidoreductase [Anaerolineae bacterium]|nr:aldehyde ferredoxin oxidoreductase [Anaerolineae bacterium]HIQ05865.1 aldehyde ferredoxin oxidoreductase [Anaerolineae bacterium]
MPYGYNGKILHVNLTEGDCWTESPAERIYRQYLGGGALGSYILLCNLPPGTDPLSPDNLLIFMTSVINGTNISGANRYSAVAKSPLTGGYGESEAGGYWGPELKRAGFDGIVVHGRAAKPVYLWVHDGECEIRDAAAYWGRLSDEVQEGLLDELGEKGIRVLQTGVAGERLVRFAAITNEMRHYHGRTGLGAVMASKNLKAIAVRGHERLELADKEAARTVLRWYREHYDPDSDMRHLWGTAWGVPFLQAEGILPTHNFRDGAFEHYEAISGQTIVKTILHRRGTCFACSVTCKREVSVPSRGVEPKFGGMEYETIAATGSLCGVGDLEAIAEASQWLNRYVMDSISTGAAIAFAMECYEHGIITDDDTDGLKLTWGNADAVIEMIHRIARREGLGNLLAEGVKRAAATLGRGAQAFAVHVKGQEVPMHDPRGKTGVGLGYAISPTGADHMEIPHDPTFENWDAGNHGCSPLGLLEPVDRFDLGPAKVRAAYYTQLAWSLYNSIGMCDFVGAPYGTLALNKLVEHVRAVTGWNVSLWELLKVGERANNMARVFNVREGFTPADDTLPQRLFEPLRNGKLAGHGMNRETFEQALRLYYEMAGWDPQTGMPTRAKLIELGLDWL